jgi:hypothetical protein
MINHAKKELTVLAVGSTGARRAVARMRLDTVAPITTWWLTYSWNYICYVKMLPLQKSEMQKDLQFVVSCKECKTIWNNMVISPVEESILPNSAYK